LEADISSFAEPMPDTLLAEIATGVLPRLSRFIEISRDSFIRTQNVLSIIPTAVK
jgi:hypothetical protein